MSSPARLSFQLSRYDNLAQFPIVLTMRPLNENCHPSNTNNQFALMSSFCFQDIYIRSCISATSTQTPFSRCKADTNNNLHGLLTCFPKSWNMWLYIAIICRICSISMLTVVLCGLQIIVVPAARQLEPLACLCLFFTRPDCLSYSAQ